MKRSWATWEKTWTRHRIIERRTKRQQWRRIEDESCKLRTKKSSEMMAFGGTRNKNNSKKHRIARKGLLMIDNKWEATRSWDDSLHKNGTRLRETLLRISKLRMMTRTTSRRINETLRDKNMQGWEKWELIQIGLDEGIWLMKIILTS